MINNLADFARVTPGCAQRLPQRVYLTGANFECRRAALGKQQ